MLNVKEKKNAVDTPKSCKNMSIQLVPIAPEI